MAGGPVQPINPLRGKQTAAAAKRKAGPAPEAVNEAAFRKWAHANPAKAASYIPGFLTTPAKNPGGAAKRVAPKRAPKKK